MFTSGNTAGYVAEKADQESGWLFPVGDEVIELGNVHMFSDMFNAIDEGRSPKETFYDGYIVNAVIDACYKSAQSRQWEPVTIEDWRGTDEVMEIGAMKEEIDGQVLVKQERMPDGKVKLILKDKNSGQITQRFVADD